MVGTSNLGSWNGHWKFAWAAWADTICRRICLNHLPSLLRRLKARERRENEVVFELYLLIQCVPLCTDCLHMSSKPLDLGIVVTSEGKVTWILYDIGIWWYMTIWYYDYCGRPSKRKGWDTISYKRCWGARNTAAIRCLRGQPLAAFVKTASCPTTFSARIVLWKADLSRWLPVTTIIHSC